MRTWILLALLLGMFFEAGAASADEWEIRQLTECGAQHGIFSPLVSRTGEMVFFISDCDLTDENGDHNTEVFKWEKGRITQLSHTKFCQIADLAFSPDDKRLAFSTNCSVGDKNSTRGVEIAYFDGPGELKFLTQGMGYRSRVPYWSTTGRRLVFESFADLAGKNMDHSSEIFMADFASNPPKIMQMTDTRAPKGCDHPSIALDSVICRCNDDIPGTRMDADLDNRPTIQNGRSVGGNPDGNNEIMRFTLDGKPKQLTYTLGCKSGPPVVHPAGRAIAFISDCPLKEVENPNYMVKLYLLGSNVKDPFTEINLPAADLVWSRSGTVLAMVSPYGEGSVNREHNPEIFTAKMDDEYVALEPPLVVSDFKSGRSKTPALNKNGDVVAFVSNGNPLRTNNDRGDELFLAIHESVVQLFEEVEYDDD